MAISGLPRPLPECTRCGNPIRRQRVAVAGRICQGCQTPAEAMAERHRVEELRRLAVDGPARVSARVDARIAALAAKRADREAAECR